MTENRFYWMLLFCGWLFLVVISLWLRPPLPMDETRYLAVAWSMWLDADWMVPSLNGEAYSHKPPLLFWLMNLGWHIFGVVEWWPRLIAPLFGFGCLIVVKKLAEQLWPEDAIIAHIAPLILFGTLFWALFGTLTMFDTLLAFFTLVAIYGIICAWRTGSWAGFLLAGVAVGFGILAKGPAIMVHILPVALSAPWWGPKLSCVGSQKFYKIWFLGVLSIILIGILIGCLWAVPAAILGGEEYKNAIFWGQSADRLVNSFAHAKPFWWYAVTIPILLLPWVTWGRAWRGLSRIYQNFDGAVGLCLIWLGSSFVIFSAISGKQLHYLLPEFPAFSLMIAWALRQSIGCKISRKERFQTAWIFIFSGIILTSATIEPLYRQLSTNLKNIIIFSDTMWAIVIIIVGVLLVLPQNLNLKQVVSCLVACAVATTISIHLIASNFLNVFYDLRPISVELRRLQDKGYAVANATKYHGQFHFLGRLEQPISVVGQKSNDLAEFLAANKNSRIVAYYSSLPKNVTPLSTFKFRRYVAAILDGNDVLKDLDLIDRN